MGNRSGLADSVGTARDALHDAVDVAHALVPTRAEEAVAFAHVAEEIGRLADALRILAAAGIVRSGACSEYSLTSPAAVLTVLCLVERAQARRRIAVAAVVADRPMLTGDVLQPLQPGLSAALRAGEVSGASAAVVVRTVETIGDVVTEASRHDLTAALLEEARTEDDAFVRSCAKRIIDDAHPQGTQPTEAVLRMKQGITFGRERDGLIPFAGTMTAMQYETVLATIGTFTNPRLRTPDRDCDTTADTPADAGAVPVDDVVVDPGDGGDPIRVALHGRTRAQLLLEGLVAACALASRTGRLPRNGGVRPAVIVTVALDDLRDQLGAASTTFIGPVPAAQIRQLACDARIIPIVLASNGAVLDQGRSVRLVQGDLRDALIARDGGCSFPRCDAPAPWSEGHHIRHWADGGPTSLENTALLCREHHTLIHTTDWRIVMTENIPHFIPPWQIDPHQHPRRNRRHRPPKATDRSRVRRPERR
ncbi:DUF222 domain-containing protein [Microbacteriaceae bacterium VKM Ac-2855]|nr:DUF222 domain-containing protein [Microbacteriaceae bacterium VKM Ac-2855]